MLRSLCAVALAMSAHAQEFGPWYVLGRFEHEFDQQSTSAVFPPEKQLKNAAGPDLSASYPGMGGESVTWKRLPAPFDANTLDCGVIDLNAQCPPPASRKNAIDDAVCYLYRRIDAPQDLELTVTVGSDDGLRLWLDGALFLDRHVARALVVQDDTLVLPLKAGAHHLVAKVSQNGGAYSFQIRPWSRIPQQAINSAIDRGVSFLIQHQLLDGSWGCWTEWGGGHAAYAAYALLKCGVAKDHPAVRMALEHARNRAMDTTYALACHILALEAQGDPSARSRMQEALDDLLAIQTNSGLFDYPVYPGGDRPPVDLSNTLYAALALRAAHEAGLEVPDNVWSKLANGALRCFERPYDVTRPDGSKLEVAGFSYRVNEGVAGSTTTAGLSVLGICLENGGDRMPAPVLGRIGQAKELGLAWLGHNLAWSFNPGQGAGHHYFWVYGIERVGALLGAEEIGGVDWYWSGAAYLIQAQKADGSWNPEGYAHHEYLDTLLALLFLKRATVRVTGESSKLVIETREPAAAVTLRATGDTPLVVWVSGLSDAVVKDFGGADAPLDVERIEYFARYAGEPEPAAPIASIAAAKAKRGELQRFALRRAFDRRGQLLVKARVFLRPAADGGAPAQAKSFDSPELEVRIDGVLDPARLQYATDLGRDLVYGAKLAYECSTKNGEGEAPAKVADGNFSTRWRCAKDDALPWLRLVPERAIKADKLLLSHAEPRLASAGSPRVSKVDVVVNRDQHFVAELDPDVLAKTVVSFGSVLPVRELELRVLECAQRESGEPVGFAEVELQKGK